jgi:hypothetical protein
MIDQTLLAMLDDSACDNGIIADYVEEKYPAWFEDGTMATIYVVVGETGEYSDHSDWYVAAFLRKEKAEEFKVALNKRLNELGCLNNRPAGWYDIADDITAAMQQMGDRQFRCDYTGTSYGVVEMPLRG